jgi:hypothetical protein
MSEIADKMRERGLISNEEPVMERWDREEKQFKNRYKKLLKGKINVSGLWKHLNSDMSFWIPVGIVEIKSTDERRSGYSTYDHARVSRYVVGPDDCNGFCKEPAVDKMLYMKTSTDDVRSIDHYYVWQTTGYIEDDYSGYLLYPLKDGTYFKLYYNC